MAYVGKAPATTALTADDLADGIVSTPKLSNDSVTSVKVVDGAIANADLTNSSITINGSAVSLGGTVTIGETKPTISSISPDTIDNQKQQLQLQVQII